MAAVAEESRRWDLALIEDLLEKAAGDPERVTALSSAERLAHLGRRSAFGSSCGRKRSTIRRSRR